MKPAARILQSVLETVTLALIAALALVVVYAVVMRGVGASPGWYDEIASNLLAWITWFGAAYAALRGSHMSVQSVLVAIPPGPRLFLFWVAEFVVFVTMVLVVVSGWKIVQTLSGEMLVSLPWLSRALAQSALPVGAALFILGRILAIPAAWSQLKSGTDADAAEIAAAIARAEEMHASSGSVGKRR